MSAPTLHTITDVEGQQWQIRLYVTVYRRDGFAITPESLRELLPGPMLARLREELCGDVEALL